MDGWNLSFLLGWPIFNGYDGYVSFRDGPVSDPDMVPQLLISTHGTRGVSMITTLRRFEIHSVEPPVGSEEGGSRVVVKGIGFGDKSITNQVGPVEIVGGDRR